jgi:glyoxylate reductase
MARVYVTRRLAGTALERLASEHQVEIWPGELPPPREQLMAKVADAEGLLSLLTDRVDDALLDAAPTLRAVANYAIGFDNIDVEAALARGIQVGNTPDVLTDATADLAWALMLASARRLVEARQAVLDGAWRTWEPQGWVGADVRGATLTVVGAGRIGRAVARRATGFDMDTTLVDIGDDLHAALERADFVSLHAPLTRDTHHIIDAEALAVMKRTAIIVNTARGPLVDHAALAAALRDGRLGAAALDVTDPEPLRADDPLLQTPNVLVVPHIGSATKRARAAMTDCAVDNLLAALDGRRMPYPVRADDAKR